MIITEDTLKVIKLFGVDRIEIKILNDNLFQVSMYINSCQHYCTDSSLSTAIVNILDIIGRKKGMN